MVKVYIDLGHEGDVKGMDPGAVANGLKEANVVLEIGKYIKDMFAEYENVEIKFSRLGDKNFSLTQRTNEANAWGADLYLSIHINAGGGTGFESYIYPGAGSKTQAFQNAVHAKIISKKVFGKDRGKKQADFHVLRETKMDAMLTENGFIDNKTDAAILKDRKKLIEIAAGHVEGVAEFLGLKKKPDPKPISTPKPDGRMHYVQIGAFSDYDNAEKLAAKAKKAGFDVYIKSE
ncbi:N-acetylmuramoyl-L-alanine amidase [Cytobacillus firmus]|uniref:N-acetylmuramoyl-L-alanine amidase n=2 Tax=Cytobacillus TaxID=2675230 RepID=A0A366JLL3_CYTFI|nr:MULTISPECIES: N-acetylmuramoyl-L-alanine amidase [Cytobacillus]RBP87891.1 N-acetylmuramoyl-L-alanine amidase [Cytobacillus firmus]TDX39254.1 N-acetylmuramoyl-L-alanine amidase [Cytobacillus oceanisediminis]